MRKLLAAAVMLAAASSAFAATYPSAQEKMMIRCIVAEVADISATAESLDDLGQKTLQQSAELLALGPGVVYELSHLLNNPDWKVRFWIADVLGYFGNPDAERPLMRLVMNEREKNSVRERAAVSLRRLQINAGEKAMEKAKEKAKEKAGSKAGL